MQLRAPAKINLSFRILGRRDDGFHEIETLMAPVSLCDELTLAATDDAGVVHFSCDDPSLPTGDDNLAVRAARLFFAATGIAGGVRIALRKRIPHGAGLGGGSSDAAAVLLGLHRMFGSGLETAALAALGAEIGSDVPFFLYRSACVCRGRGELVEPAPLPDTLPLLLLKPAFGVATPWAYGRWKGSKELPGIRYDAQSFGGAEFVNDLERPVFEKYVFLARLKMWLLAQPEVGAALLSGSGSTVLAVLRENGSADDLTRRAEAELDRELWSCACETLSGDAVS
ncbi:MAG: 4-diphosphocytidyl-2-C-methyl-D-erythritol kinase [uncultured Chthoniobacterales bacterium]|uniref:4-diphosphocytidyl-2-C-methyl-D-erythritol kinase n=1 Tax=uncultured Chthoniobacterales bacterium TaxID=1836801 RepID=A0A6J4HLL9_9BACT|nr:MAG: 4-diphosphocytidyl-2-C-methyl-D-erythritol kinase [uncultured Chthoniobacterales bacterium]